MCEISENEVSRRSPNYVFMQTLAVFIKDKIPFVNKLISVIRKLISISLMATFFFLSQFFFIAGVLVPIGVFQSFEETILYALISLVLLGISWASAFLGKFSFTRTWKKRIIFAAVLVGALLFLSFTPLGVIVILIVFPSAWA